ncbi:DUF5333 domain-containing protein [Sulfitobacter sp. S190]|uniref:DUF5333 domain-containing protein n=1 Tax=Sulfitobacter sp. S190 TaxID=2867022 RepID=UPI0021A3BC08|nr:DUF5333 domain-containing protein [Sulfitobacter sp. S190]UWR23693.1 DUF5333 domain-containing protein [Sulfitobacter sp. S190]
MRTLILTLTAATLLAAPLAAKPALRDVKSIDDAVFDVAIADQIRKKCPSISARMLKAINFAYKTKAAAKDLGYTDDEIDAYLDSDAEKARMRARGNAYFEAQGVDTSDPQSYCALGLQEIGKSSRIGSLLKAK